MNNTLILLRHAATLKDNTIPVSQWILTDEGRTSAQALADTGTFDNINIIISSCEPKAYQTAQPFADRLKKAIIKIPELNELNRDNGGMLTSEAYEQMKRIIFEDFDYTNHVWETAGHALNRFKEAVKQIDNQYENRRILIVTHSTVMTLYFAHLLNTYKNLFSMWERLAFLRWGIIRNNKVTKYL